MGFNLYLAGGDSVPLELTPEDNVGILTSFADGPKAVKKFIEKRHCKTFCDSGAYGVAHSGKVIDLDEYIEFINNTPDCTVFAGLDVIAFGKEGTEAKVFSAEESWKNYKYMIKHVKPEYRQKIIPTYHYGEPENYLYQIIDGFDGYKPDYIAFGGRAGVSTKDLYKFFDHSFWDWVKNSSNPNVKIHAFGVTVFDMLERYPWYSADSTTWLRTGIAGNIHTRYRRGVLNISDQRKGDLNHLDHQPEAFRDLIYEEVESRTYTLNGETKHFTIPDLTNDYKLRHIWNCLYYKDWADNFVYQPKQKSSRKKLINVG